MKKFAWILALGLSTGFATAGDIASSEKTVVEPEIPVPCLVYDFIDVGYLYTDFGSHGIDDGHGVGVHLSKSLTGNVYMTASGAWTSTEVHYLDAEFYGASVGLGYIYEISDSLHLNLEAGGVWSGAEIDYYGSSDEFGGFVGPGFRYCMAPGLEVYGNAYYVLYEGGYDTWDLNLGVVYDVCETAALTVSGLYSVEEEDLGIFAGVRLYY